MCGIIGFIGTSKNPNLSYEIVTNVFEQMEVRGIDAAGYWATNWAGATLTHKEPVRSSEFVKTTLWKQLAAFGPDLLLCHARAASRGEPSNNINNHPFISQTGRLCLIHNGMLPEYDTLKNQYTLTSECDSEILLRMLEKAPDRLQGVSDIFSWIQQGHMATAIGEITEKGKEMWLFRNQHRPLCIIDLREPLGQIFFCSTRQIWQDSLHNTNYKFYSRQRVIELEPGDVWRFRSWQLPTRYVAQRLL